MTKVSNNKRAILIFRTSITTELEIERIKILFAQYSQIHKWYLQTVVTQCFVNNKSEIWS